MRKFLKKAFLLLFLFCLVLGGAITYNWYRNREEVSYTTMQKATLPVVNLRFGEDYSCSFHGYLDEMDYNTMRPAITPLTDRRRLTVSIDTYGSGIDQVIYQLRSLDGERLVEDGIMDKWTQEENTMTQELQLANLMEDGREYTLVLMLRRGDQTIRYYSRVIYMAENHTDTLVRFVHDFSQATYSDDPEMIVNYLQPNDTMGTDDLSYINIHSRYRMFTWNGLHPTVTGDVETEITELSDSQMSVSLRYPISIAANDAERQYDIEEQFVVRFRSDTLYLLDYERFMTEQFSFSRMQFDNGNIWLGITAEESDTMLSPDGKTQAFVYQGQLWSYESEKETMSSVFSYQDGEDKRGSLARHTIELVRVTDRGDIDFIVYGYHNRGLHEGRVGVCFYRYLKSENRMEELFYIPTYISEDVMQTEMGALAYVSDTDLLYFLYGTTMYSVDLTSQEKMELATQDNADGFYRNEAASIVAWHEGTAGQAEQIVIMNLENGRLFRINAEEGEFLRIQGFIGTDIIYGVGKISDAGILSGVKEIAPMYMLCFAAVGETLEESGSYQSAGICIAETKIDENEIEISRVTKNGAAYEPMANDQVFLNDREEVNTSGTVRGKQDETLLKVCYINLGITANNVTLEPQRCQYEEKPTENILTVNREPADREFYYVYGKGGLLSVRESLSDAIREAYDAMGCVLDRSQNYLWTRGTRDLFKNLTLEQMICESESLSLETALRMFLAFEGASDRAVEGMLNEGQSLYEILSDRLKSTALDLTGCSVSQILYYIHNGHPVLAQTGDHSAVLITGYETKAVTVYNPYNGVTSQMTMEEAEAYFSGLGYRFFSCL